MPRVPGMRETPILPPLPPGAAAVPQEPVVVQEIVLYNCAVRSSDIPDGGKILRFICPNGITISVPLSEKGIEVTIQALKGTDLTVAQSTVVIPG